MGCQSRKGEAESVSVIMHSPSACKAAFREWESALLLGKGSFEVPVSKDIMPGNDGSFENCRITGIIKVILIFCEV